MHTLVNNKTEWKVRSLPAIIRHLNAVEDGIIPQLPEPTHQPYTHPIAPWNLFEINTGYFPLNKKKAINNTALTSTMFLEIRNSEHKDHIAIFTDGSTCLKTLKTTCAVYIPETDFKKAWLLTEPTNSLNAELAAIKQTLKCTYNQIWNEITILTDSKSAIQAISNFKWETSTSIPEIIQEINNLKSAGTKINLYWIPSHSGIRGNEIADQLANIRRSADDGATMTHSPNMAEILTKIKNKHQNRTLEKIKQNSTNQAVTNRNRMGVCTWHTHRNRAIQTALMRLRSGHNKLNATISKWDMNVQPECPNGCAEKENTEHVLIHCPHYSRERRELSDALEELNLPLEVPTLTGINFNIPKHTQGKIAKALIKYITDTKIIERI
ncbi:uncharacterized protein LOC123466852 [Daphnia magna]|uniref:uncharacterized protein LOC123466852 n=1 Tax=Daphnia magna TaxID=35525 RepID=UPI001E1BBA4E|nr:uncharacterized protein LOC123466852 [Daphnia magna]